MSCGNAPAGVVAEVSEHGSFPISASVGAFICQ